MIFIEIDIMVTLAAVRSGDLYLSKAIFTPRVHRSVLNNNLTIIILITRYTIYIYINGNLMVSIFL